MDFSLFGNKFARTTAIAELMDDLGKALSTSKKTYMLGGGNPSIIPQIIVQIQNNLQNIASSQKGIKNFVSIYDPPQGDISFINSVASYLRSQLKWDITSENIAITNGSQTAFFILFNLFSGKFMHNQHKKILLPICPEYIGYTDIGLHTNIFETVKPKIAILSKHEFKYQIDFSSLRITNKIGAVCISRPTNPTGNVVTDTELKTLIRLIKDKNIPLIIDSAYGQPFPNILFTQAHSYFQDNIIFVMSLSKLGLPAVRTGIVIASKKIIDAVTKVNAVMCLAPGGMGPVLAENLFKKNKITTLCNKIIRPYYENKLKTIRLYIKKYFKGFPYYIHKPEGAFFIWIWFPKLPITSRKLYEKLKKKNVIIVPGEYFFPGLNKSSWKHTHECIRISYTQDDVLLKEGIKRIAHEVHHVYHMKRR